MAEPTLDAAAERLVAEARRAVLTTIDTRDGRPRSVPICFAARPADGGLVLYSALDEKPKARSDPRRLTRVRNLLADPRATILVDRWDEDWSRLEYVELDCRGRLLEPEGEGEAEHRLALGLLRAKYRQYGDQRLESRPVLRFEVVRAVSWRAASP